jgi:hypothetical protein
MIASSSQAHMDEFKASIKQFYSMKDLGELKYCLGMEIIRDWDAGTVTLTQSKFITLTQSKFTLWLLPICFGKDSSRSIRGT